MQETMSRFQPMNLGDILNTTFNLYRENFVLFAGICAVIVIPEAILAAAFALSHSVLFALLAGLLALAVPFLLTGALAQAVSARYLGKPMTIAEAYESLGTGTVLTLVGVSFLGALLVIIGLIIFIIPGIYIGVRFTVSAQAAVLERQSVTNSLRRSWNLVEGNWWRVFGIVLVVAILVFLLETLVGRLVGAVVGAALGTGLSTVVVGIVIQPIQSIALTLLYYDLRIRKEGGNVPGGAETSSRWGA
jgi:hypothetical protein